MGILKKLTHYGIWQFAVLGGVFYLLAHFPDSFFYEVSRNSLFTIPKEYYINLMYFLLFALLLLIVFLYEQITIYKDKTNGRNYLKDRSMYRRSWFEMMEYFQQSDKYRYRKEEFPEQDWRNSDGIILGKVDKHLIKRDSDAKGNLALFALPGGGKTTSQMITTALRFGGSILAIDIKGDILAITKKFRKIKVFSPDQAEGSCHFNLLYGLKDMAIKDRKIALEQMAMILVPSEKESYFSDGGRDFFCGIALYLLSENPDLTFPNLVKSIIYGNSIEWVKRIRDSDCASAKQYTDSFYNTNERNVAGAYQNLSKKIRPLSNGDLDILLDGQGDCITPQTLEDGYDIYIEIPQNKIATYAPLTTIIVQIFMTSFLSRPDMSTGKKQLPILFLLDEFDQLGFDYETLMTALATLRSKKVSLFMAQQSISQLKRRYGDEGFRGIIDTCGYVCLMSAQDPDNREYFQKLVGKHKVYHSAVSDNEKVLSRSSQEVEEYIFQSQDFNNMGSNVLIYSSGKYILAEKCNLENQEALTL